MPKPLWTRRFAGDKAGPPLIEKTKAKLKGLKDALNRKPGTRDAPLFPQTAKFCYRGHPQTVANTYVYAGNRRIYCRRCVDMEAMTWQKRNPEKWRKINGRAQRRYQQRGLYTRAIDMLQRTIEATTADPLLVPQDHLSTLAHGSSGALKLCLESLHHEPNLHTLLVIFKGDLAALQPMRL